MIITDEEEPSYLGDIEVGSHFVSQQGDELVEMALRAFHYGCSVGAPDPLSMKDALNAVAPYLRREGLREAAAITRKRREELLAVGLPTAGLEGLELTLLQAAQELENEVQTNPKGVTSSVK